MNRTPVGAFPPSPAMQVDPLNRTSWFSPDGQIVGGISSLAPPTGIARFLFPERDFLPPQHSLPFICISRGEMPQLVGQIPRSGVNRSKNRRDDADCSNLATDGSRSSQILRRHRAHRCLSDG